MIVLGLGTNAGDRLGYLRRAILELSLVPGIEIDSISPIYESAAMLPPGAPESWDRPYLNLALACRLRNETPLSPLELLETTQAIEKNLGRESLERWAPRVIDIDILNWNDQQITSERLEIPHAGVYERPFALLPLVDLDPELANHSLLRERGAQSRVSRWRFEAEDKVPFQTRVAPRYLLPELMGVLNLTPDSFSDGGRFEQVDRAVEQAMSLIHAGATVLDLGAESTRPGATLVDPETEWKRLEPVLEALRPAVAGSSVQLSVDTRHTATAARALKKGADWLNDVSGLDQPEMRRIAADSRAKIVVMHHLGIPPSAERTLPESKDPTEEILIWGRQKLAELDASGISRDRVILDPGIGFGKTPKQSLQILNHAHRLKGLGVQILIGHSRKSFLRILSERPAADRDLETSIVSTHLARNGVDFIRVHDVSLNLRALRTSLSLDGVIRWTRRS